MAKSCYQENKSTIIQWQKIHIFLHCIHSYMQIRDMQVSPVSLPYCIHGHVLSRVMALGFMIVSKGLREAELSMAQFQWSPGSTSSWIDCNKSQLKFIFPRHLHSCYPFCLPFFLNLHYCYTCFNCSYQDNDYSNNKYFSVLIPMATRKMHI
jgi:hypothetical protein